MVRWCPKRRIWRMVGSSVKKTMEESYAARRSGEAPPWTTGWGLGVGSGKWEGIIGWEAMKKMWRYLQDSRLSKVWSLCDFFGYVWVISARTPTKLPNYSVAQIALERSLGVKAAAYAENDGATQFGSSKLTNWHHLPRWIPMNSFWL